MSKSCHVLLLSHSSRSLSSSAVPAPSLFMFGRTLRRNLVQILFDILRWPGDIHCLLCFLWIPLFWFLSSHFRLLLLSRLLSECRQKGNCLQRQACLSTSAASLSLTLSLGYCSSLITSPHSSPTLELYVCVSVYNPQVCACFEC